MLQDTAHFLVAGTLIDGNGGPPVRDVVIALAGGTITGVGRRDEFASALERSRVDARGKIVCPGFVDANGHSDWTFFANPTQASTIRQGVTTAWQRAVDSVCAARSAGVNVLCDTTPFRYGTGLMVSILPPWIATQSPARIAELLGDPAVRTRLRGECDRYWRFLHCGEWARACRATSAFPTTRAGTSPRSAS